MNRLSNLPPGVTDGMIEEHATGYDEYDGTPRDRPFELPADIDAADLDYIFIRGLKSKLCICGENKRPRMSHCRTCYYTLPPESRQALYLPIGEGYAEAFLISCTKIIAANRTTTARLMETFAIWKG